MALATFLPEVEPLAFAIIFGAVAVLATLYHNLTNRPAFPKNAPKLTNIAWPIVGSHQFFTNRWEFYQAAKAGSKTGNFSFYAGQHPVVGVSGQEARKMFFDTPVKELGFSEGYAALLGGTPEVKREGGPAKSSLEDNSFTGYFHKRLINLVKGNRLKNGLSQLMKDARANFDNLAADPNRRTDPFESVYRLVFQFTMRTVACNEIADDPVVLAKCLEYFEMIESTATPFSIMYPWLPLPAKLKRTWGGAQLYMIFKRIVDARHAEGRREDDGLQYLLDQGDNITDIITFVLGALFAGQLNSGINAAWTLMYMINKPEWIPRAREQVTAMAARYCEDKSLPLKDQLMHVPIEAWENELPLIDLFLKDSIRLQTMGTAFRKNVSGRPMPIPQSDGEVIPDNSYVAWHIGDLHYNPDVYTNPDEWDPSRYMEGRQEDKQFQFAWIGWGVGRHPCLGRRFAELENNLIVAFFLAYFDDLKLTDETGKERGLPRCDRNNPSAKKPLEKVWIQHRALEV
ncbi:hypothetical protein D0863_06348 [Hortaea werneckii]|uniref:Cytochrome P450 6A1 n=1 Tax=Hortaea werneckii TaxID=91943 RepID=A0A3M7DZN3_HORWE|nr:hypothetical protein D0863_06348 [Hortaea werneckii]